MRKQFVAVLTLSSCLTVTVVVNLVNSQRSHKLMDVYSQLEVVSLMNPSLMPINLNVTVSNQRLINVAVRVQHIREDAASAVTFGAPHQQDVNSSGIALNPMEAVRRLQTQRQQKASEFCRDHTRSQAVRDFSSPYLRHIVHNLRNRFAFCEIGKVASSTWRTVLKAVAGDGSGARRSTQFHPLRHVEQNDKHFKFVFVRHPFDRLVSAYMSKFVHHTVDDIYWLELTPRIIGRYRSELTSTANPVAGITKKSSATSDVVTFPEFVRYILDVPPGSPRKDFHWLPQTLVCQPCRVKYNFIGHYETLYNDAEYVLRVLKAFDRVKFPRLDNSTTMERLRQQSTQRTSSMLAQLTWTEIEQLKAIYRFDFDMFGYDPDMYNSSHGSTGAT